MQPDANKLLQATGITTPLIGFYDTPDIAPFAPFVEAKGCFFSAYDDWLQGRSVILSEESFTCMGSGYWLCGVESIPRDKFVAFLAKKEGLKASSELIEQWLDNQKPYLKENQYVVVGPLKEEQYEYLKTITFYVNPDQLSLLITGAGYDNSLVNGFPVIARFGSGCSQLSASFDNLKAPLAIIGAMDAAMRQHLPPEILAVTVTTTMFEQLCTLDENSFLHKAFWKKLKRARAGIHQT